MDSQAAEKGRFFHLLLQPLIIRSGEPRNRLPAWNSAEDSSEQEKAALPDLRGGGKVT